MITCRAVGWPPGTCVGRRPGCGGSVGCWLGQSFDSWGPFRVCDSCYAMRTGKGHRSFHSFVFVLLAVLDYLIEASTSVSFLSSSRSLPQRSQ